MLTFLRALTYATLFVALFLIVVPQRILAGSGVARIDVIGVPELLGLLCVVLGGSVRRWSSGAS